MNIVYRIHPGEGSKLRPDWFSKRASLANLLRVFGREHQYHFIVDGEDATFNANLCEFVKQFRLAPTMTFINERHSARAFRRMLDYACALTGMLYLVEDDYLHRRCAAQVLVEGVLGSDSVADYVTLYDHPGRYPPDGVTRLQLGYHCHWRETPSTTCTFAVKAETLREDRSIWESHCSEVPDWIHDNDAFIELTTGRQGRTVASSVPAFSTHCEERWLAPLVDWAEVNRQ